MNGILSSANRPRKSALTSIDLHIRLIWNLNDDRIRAHVFLCVLAYYVKWHMRDSLREIIFDDGHRGEPRAIAHRNFAKSNLRENFFCSHYKRRKCPLPESHLDAKTAGLIFARINTPSVKSHFFKVAIAIARRKPSKASKFDRNFYKTDHWPICGVVANDSLANEWRGHRNGRLSIPATR